jgi:hypothetical protein
MAGTEGVAHLHRDEVWVPVYVCRSEPEEAKPRADEAILAAVVVNQPIAVVAAVIFDCQTLQAVKQVWTPQETAVVVMDRNLNIRPGKSSEHEEHSQPGLHRGLGLRVSLVHNPPKPGDALCSRMLGDIAVQLGDGYQFGMEEHVRCDDSFR